MKVLLVGYFGHGNPGDDIALGVVTERLQHHGIEYRILGYGKSAARSLFDIRVEIANADAVIFPGGNVLQNETSTRSLLYYLGIIRRAAKIGVPILFISSGVGRIRGKRLTERTLKVLGSIEFFGARTSRDLDFLKRTQIIEKLIVPDPVFAYSMVMTKSCRKQGKIAYIVKYGDPHIQEVLLNIQKALALTVVVIPLFYKEDFEAARLAAMTLDAPISVPADKEALLSELSGACFTVSERLHGAILSLISGTHAFLPDDCGKCLALYDEISRRAKKHSSSSPVMLFDELTVEKAIELGAQSSEFEKILNELKCDTEAGLSYFLKRLTHTQSCRN